MEGKGGQVGSEGSGEFQVLLEEIRWEVHVVADGHNTLHQQMERFAGELQGEMKQLNQKMDLYLGGLREEMRGDLRGLREDMHELIGGAELRLSDKMEKGFEVLGKQLQAHVHLN
jgi:hypothetical protein